MIEIHKFSAEWCGPCKQLSVTLKTIEADVTVIEHDIDQEMDLARDNNVRGVPTMILMKDGKEVSRLVGAKTKQEIENWIGCI